MWHEEKRMFWSFCVFFFGGGVVCEDGDVRVLVLLVGFILTCLMMFLSLLFGCFWMVLGKLPLFSVLQKATCHMDWPFKNNSTFQADGSEGELRGLGLPVLLCRQHLIWNPTTEILPALGWTKRHSPEKKIDVDQTAVAELVCQVSLIKMKEDGTWLSSRWLIYNDEG